MSLYFPAGPSLHQAELQEEVQTDPDGGHRAEVPGLLQDGPGPDGPSPWNLPKTRPSKVHFK